MNRKSVVLRAGTLNIIAQLITVPLSFINRTVFLATIGGEVLAVQGVLQSVLGMLALTELGIQSAIVYRLYKPLAANDHETVNCMISLMRRIYSVVGCVIFALGLLLMPFLQHFFKDTAVPMMQVRWYFLLMLLTSSASYFLAYKRTLLYADQQMFTTTAVDTAAQMISAALKIFVMLALHSFTLFLLVAMAQTIGSNVYLHFVCRKKYPWLRTDAKVDAETRRAFWGDTRNIFIGRIAGYVYTSTDNLVISGFVKTGLVTYLDNYRTILNAVQQVSSAVISPIAPMVGNYLATESKEDAHKLFYNYTFTRYSVCLMLLMPTACLSGIFVGIYAGQSYVMSQTLPLMIFIDWYMSCLMGSSGDFINALGYFGSDKYVYYAGAALNLSVSIVGAITIGVEGVLLGTLLSQLVMWFGRSFILFKRYFGLEYYAAYWARMVGYAALPVGLYFVLFHVILPRMPWQTGLLAFLTQGIVCVAVTVLVWAAIFFRTAEFRYLLSVAGKLTEKIKEKLGR